jgi:protein phosphatase
MNTSVAARSDVGRVREANEDSYLVREPVFAVADGMGGHIAGDVASQTAVETIEREMGNGAGLDPDRLVGIVQSANAAIWERAKGDPTLRGMGTTCTLAFLAGGEIHLAHVGDSRGYLYRDGELSQITEDHTLVGRMVREGRLTAGEAERHPQRSIITRALGVDEHVEVDTITLTVKEGDRILLCSDGLTSMIGTGEIRDVLSSQDEAQAAADRLVELANSAGGEDNITVVLVDITSGEAARGPDASRESAPAPPPVRIDTQPAPLDAPPAVTTGVHRLEDLGITAGTARRRPWKALAALSVVALLLGGGYLAARWALDNSWYVGVDNDGTVAIYRGIPEEVLGMSLNDEERVTNLDAEDLPDFLREDVESGIKVESLGEAESTVDDLTSRARDLEFERQRERENKNGGGG